MFENTLKTKLNHGKLKIEFTIAADGLCKGDHAPKAIYSPLPGDMNKSMTEAISLLKPLKKDGAGDNLLFIFPHLAVEVTEGSTPAKLEHTYEERLTMIRQAM